MTTKWLYLLYPEMKHIRSQSEGKLGKGKNVQSQLSEERNSWDLCPHNTCVWWL